MKKIYTKYKEIINYIIVGGLTTCVSLLTYYLLTFTILNPNISIELQIATIISWIISVLFAFFTNKKYVFESKNKFNFKEITSFILSRLSTLLIEMLLMYLFVTVCKYNDKIMKIVVQIIIIILNYLLSKFLVFKKKN
ncbi:MAG: GtrA family protein [Erysipelotrichaceae bacterium]|nr:GtrA family protein [Erysipelotrichaceae bacterium]